MPAPTLPRPPQTSPANPTITHHLSDTMPVTRRSRNSSGPVAKGAQSRLSFGSKVTKSTTPSSKIHKPTSASTPPAKREDPVTLDQDEVDVGHVDSSAAVAQQAQAELAKPVKTEAEERADKVSDAQIRKYWRAHEMERKAPRVHQQDLGVEEKILRLFDMSSQYGPCIGIARMKRWNRAYKLGLQPPIEVLAVLLKEEEKGNNAIERAHVDSLMSSKFVVGEA
ncbi:hypothetical protein BP6252_06219 [Coleophoma cylindrospora]|uniref:DNA polymerase delta subunit 4 n=1 Tax=Coleophoma cylindrospora TaxID=1849047 RepID=A0A3D8RLY8_9HELO|nr:hypothetical protein BP6252_06219 [Coleophoma cylindrospora]